MSMRSNSELMRVDVCRCVPMRPDAADAVISHTADQDVAVLGASGPIRILFERLFHAQQLQRPRSVFFSQSGLLVRPHRARMTDSLLEKLVFLKCNSCSV